MAGFMPYASGNGTGSASISFLEDPHRHNWKSALQELTQAQKAGLPVYATTEESKSHGDPRRFRSEVSINDQQHGTGWGPSRRLAEQEAARKPLRSSSLLQGLKRQGHELELPPSNSTAASITADALHKALVAVVDRAAIIHPHGAARENHHHNLEALQAKRRWQRSS